MDDGLRRKVARGVVTKLFGNTPFQLSKVFLIVLCLRVLTPEEYGWASLALAIYGFSDLLTNPGVRTYLIQSPHCSDYLIDVAWSVSAARGVLLSVVFWIAAPALSAGFGGDDLLTSMLRTLSLSFVVNGLKNLHTIRYQQQLRFGIVMLAETGGALLGTLATIGALIHTRDPFVLVGGVVLCDALTSGLTWLFAPARHRIRWDTAEVRTMWSFTRHLLVNAVIIYFIMNLDDLLVARLLGSAALGVYSMAYSMVNWSVLFVTRPLGDLLMPTLSTLLKDKAAFTRATKGAVSAFATISWGIIATLWVLTEDVFAVFAVEEKWQQAAPIFRALLPFVLVRGINQSLGAMVVAAGRPRTLTLVSGTQLLLMIPVAFVGLRVAGFLGLTLALSVLNAGAMFAVVFFSRSFIQAPRRHLLLLIFAPAPPACMAALIGGWAGHALEDVIARFIVGAATAFATYALLWEISCRAKVLGRLGAYPLSTLWISLRRASD